MTSTVKKPTMGVIGFRFHAFQLSCSQSVRRGHCAVPDIAFTPSGRRPRAFALEIGLHPGIVSVSMSSIVLFDHDLLLPEDSNAVADRKQAVAEVVSLPYTRSVRGCRAVWRSAHRIPAAPIGSRPEVGSSRNTRSGSSASARQRRRALDSCCRKVRTDICPPPRRARPTSSIFNCASSSIIDCGRSRYSRIGTWMFSRTVSAENSAPCWKRTPSFMSSRSCSSVALSKSTPKMWDLAGAARQKTQHRAHQHRLAGVGRADETEDFAAVNIEIELVEDDVVIEADGQILTESTTLSCFSVATSMSIPRSRSRRRTWRTDRR